MSRVADAICRQVRRHLGLTPTPQQRAASDLLRRGVVVEMDAGEGKTLAAAMAAAEFASSGRRVHILTANDYLANRDYETLRPALESLSISVGLVTDDLSRDERRMRYAAQIVFTTAREVGFDYLRNSVAASPDHRVEPSFDVAIVDEADHLLIDQARTPLIISGEPLGDSTLGEDCQALAVEMIERQAQYVDRLYDCLEAEPGRNGGDSRLLATILLAGGLTGRLASTLDTLGTPPRQVMAELSRLNDEDDGSLLERDLLYAVEPHSFGGSGLRLTERGWDMAMERLAIYGDGGGRVFDTFGAFEVVQTLNAHVVHDADTDYVVGDDGVTLVDRLDGRPMPSHRYMDGLHEALETKEGLEAQGRAPARARTTIRALMSNYRTVSGLTGTALEAADTLARDYGVETVRVPPEVESRRVDLGATVYFDRETHLRALCDEVCHWNRLGRPTLVAAGTVGESDTISAALHERGIEHRLLNAANPEYEPEIVAAAGEFGAVTISTGMAGRGTDIIVTSEVDAMTASRLSADMRADAGERPDDAVALGLFALIASLPRSARVERQLRGRTGRQGGFGASKMMLYVNDPALAFSRRQGDLLALRRDGEASVSGPEVLRILRAAQADIEMQGAAAAEAMSEFEAAIESECRAHYATRRELMGSRQPARLVERMVTDWVGRRTSELDDQRGEYATRFAIVSDGLWHGFGIDIGVFDDSTPAEARRALTDAVMRRFRIHRDRLGAKRLALAAADACLRAADDLWPARLASMQDMALSAAIGGGSRRSAVSDLSEWIGDSRAAYWYEVEDRAIRAMLVGTDVADSLPMGDNHIEALPDELGALLG